MHHLQVDQKRPPKCGKRTALSCGIKTALVRLKKTALLCGTKTASVRLEKTARLAALRSKRPHTLRHDKRPLKIQRHFQAVLRRPGIIPVKTPLTAVVVLEFFITNFDHRSTEFARRLKGHNITFPTHLTTCPEKLPTLSTYLVNQPDKNCLIRH